MVSLQVEITNPKVKYLVIKSSQRLWLGQIKSVIIRRMLAPNMRTSSTAISQSADIRPTTVGNMHLALHLAMLSFILRFKAAQKQLISSMLVLLFAELH